jgi:hypothetical protein
MKFYDDPRGLRGEAQDLRFKSFDGIDTRPIIVEGSNIETRVGSYMPNRLSHAMFKQTSLAKVGQPTNMIVEPQINDYFAMPMGTIVSCTHFGSISETVLDNGSSVIGGPGTALAEFGINVDGEIAMAVNRNNALVSQRADTEWFGYPKGLDGLIDIHTGSTVGYTSGVEDPYSVWDVDAETIAVDPSTGAALTPLTPQFVQAYSGAGAITPGLDGRLRYNIPTSTPNVYLDRPKFPYGIVINDIPLDIEGRLMNYSQQLQKGYAVMFKGRIRIFFVYNRKVTGAGTCDLQMGVNAMYANSIENDSTSALASNLFAPQSRGYAAIRGKYPFLLIDQGLINTFYGSGSDIRPESGMLVASNRDGKFIISDPSNNPISNVGRLEVLDSRFPRHQNEIVQSFPGSETTGTQTGGIDAHLYQFAKAVLTALPTGALKTYYNPANPAGIVRAIQDGLFGYAHIYVDLLSTPSNF